MTPARDMPPAQRVMAVVASLILAAGMAGLSQVPVATADGDARVRLSWRNEPIRVEECRTLSDEDQADVPAHMRRAQSCTGYRVDYELRLEIDGQSVAVDTVAPSGLRRDRPVYVLRDIAVPPGRHDVEVSYAALVPEDYQAEGLPAAFGWSGDMELGPGDVGVLTLGDNGRSLIRVERP
ncbi:MAG: hypothetical protein HKN72_04480 [Gemmatimonadetes bacterium]|nr:hypothetical protein [Gemmatimonadota bacterium]NNF12450.1 hypothetical protein [Gemmatimonadota bacterium]NNL30270.1 hypothetical protein [Gemmatimonadota bacterium]